MVGACVFFKNAVLRGRRARGSADSLDSDKAVSDIAPQSAFDAIGHGVKARELVGCGLTRTRWHSTDKGAVQCAV